ncbi:hypothetical protein GTS_39830 [Gandjariella thermophila]|uniref:MFS transporter n=1 Tax=Gandjariella thermophila TaxID=1931992 RepID=A0A4D4JBF2_9PSEU|nr:hypothetical protein GTS_39830 [Gandjariella thermophila]
MRVAALPLFTAVNTGSPLAVSAVAVAEVLPWLAVALPAGALVDRWRPRRVVVVAHAVRAVATAALTAAVVTGHAGVTLLVAVAFLLTSAETFADSASQSLLVGLAGPTELERANGRFVTAETVGLDLGGPLAASALFLWHPAACFALDTLSFVVAAVLVAGLPDVVPAREAPSAAGRAVLATLREEVVRGGAHLLRSSPLRVLLTAVAAAAFGVSAANAVIPLYALRDLAVPAAVVPTLWVVMSLGTLAAATAAPRMVRAAGEGRVLVGALLLLAGGYLVVGMVPRAGAVWGAYAVVGFAAGAWNVLSATRRQRLTPGSMMGRVTSSYRLFAWGLMPLGAGVAGPLAVATSLGTVFVVAGAVIAVTAVVLARPLSRPVGVPRTPSGA